MQRASRLAAHVVEDDDDREVLGGGWMAGRQRDAAALGRSGTRGRRLAGPHRARRLAPHTRRPSRPARAASSIPSLGAEVVDRGAGKRVPVVVDDDDAAEGDAVVERLQSGAVLVRLMAARSAATRPLRIGASASVRAGGPWRKATRSSSSPKRANAVAHGVQVGARTPASHSRRRYGRRRGSVGDPDAAGRLSS